MCSCDKGRGRRGEKREQSRSLFRFSEPPHWDVLVLCESGVPRLSRLVLVVARLEAALGAGGSVVEVSVPGASPSMLLTWLDIP